jgi:hypothetical protein
MVITYDGCLSAWVMHTLPVNQSNRASHLLDLLDMDWQPYESAFELKE